MENDKFEELWDKYKIVCGYTIKSPYMESEEYITQSNKEYDYTSMAMGFNENDDEVIPFIAQYKGDNQEVSQMPLSTIQYTNLYWDKDLEMLYKGDNGLYTSNSWSDSSDIADFCDAHNISYSDRFSLDADTLINNGYEMEDMYKWFTDVDAQNIQEDPNTLYDMAMEIIETNAE